MFKYYVICNLGTKNTNSKTCFLLNYCVYKTKDLRDNMDLDRLKQITEKDIERLEKYKKAKEILENIK